MSSQEEEKKPPISRLGLFFLYFFTAFIMLFVFRLFIEDLLIRLIIVSALLLPIYAYLDYRYFHKPTRLWRPKIRGGTHCPHHPEKAIVGRCGECDVPICELCQDFKFDMKKQLLGSGWPRHQTEYDLMCVDCFFGRGRIVIKIMYLCIPIGLTVGIGLVLGSFFFTDLFVMILLLIFGILMLLLGIVATIGIFKGVPKYKKLERQFQATIKGRISH